METQLKEQQAGAELMLESDITSTTSLVLDSGSMGQIMEMAKIMATGRATVPKHLQGNPADCAAIIMQSMQWRANPFAIAQKTHIVSGVLGYEAQLVNAIIISRAPIKERLHFEWSGDWSKIVGKFREIESKTKKDDDGNFKKYRVPAWKVEDEAGLKVKVWATFKGESEPRVLELFMTQARTRNSTLWTDDPKQQLAYLATKRWARLYCPDVILGVYTPDELDEERPEREIGPARQTATEVAEAARPKVDEGAREILIEQLEKVMKEKGLEGMRNHWTKVWTKEQRVAVGAAERDRIAAMEVTPADKEPIEAEPKKDAKTEPVREAGGPSCADLLIQVANLTPASYDEEVSRILTDSASLSQDQRDKIAAAIESKEKILNG